MKGYNQVEELENMLCDDADENRKVKHYSHELLFYLDGNELSKNEQIEVLRRTIGLIGAESIK